MTTVNPEARRAELLERLQRDLDQLGELVPRLEGRHRAAADELVKAQVIRRHVARNPEKFSPHEREGVFERTQNLAVEAQVLESHIEAARERLALLEEIMPMLAEQEASAGPQFGALEVHEAVEAERLRIARDLHDGPAQVLSNLVLEAEVLERLLRRDPELLAAELQDFKISVSNAVSDLRRFMFDLRPISLDDLGLIATMKKITGGYQDRTGVVCHFNVQGNERRPPPEIEEALYWIINEALTNVQRHAQARNVDLVLDFQNERITLRIHDDGLGFDPRTYHQPGGRRKMGVLGMKERAAAIGGWLEVRSRPEAGTDVEAHFGIPRPSKGSI